MQLINSNAASTVISLNPQADAAKAQLLRSAALIDRVTDANEQATAVTLGRSLRAALAGAEASRVAVKAPVLNLGKQIDAIAKSYCAELEVEASRIGRLVAGFQDVEAKRVAEEKRIRDAEVAEAERYRLECEANARKQEQAMQDEAGLQRAIAAEQAAKEADEQARAAIVQPLPTVDKARGTMVKKKPIIKVVDIHAVYKHSHSLVRLELNLSALNEIIYEGVEIPGVKIEWETQVVFRA